MGVYVATLVDICMLVPENRHHVCSLPRLSGQFMSNLSLATILPACQQLRDTFALLVYSRQNQPQSSSLYPS